MAEGRKPPPQSPEELLERYAAGEREFARTSLSLAHLSGANLNGANLNGANLGGANLRGANLRGANLLGANLGVANLRGAKLAQANLGGSKLSGAKLSGANLSGANLSGAVLLGAKLDQANLGGADLCLAHLEGTGLLGANLGSARLSYTTLTRSNLSATHGLVSCHHEGPSSLDHETLRRSPNLPVEFLRGCGLQDWEIEAAKLYRAGLSDEELTDITYRIHELKRRGLSLFYSVFLSHSHADKSFARALHDALQDQGIRCWLDEKQLKPGDRIYEAIDHGIKHWDKVVLCCSRAALEESWWVDHEVEKALGKEQVIKREEKRTVSALVPLTLDDFVFEWDGEFASEVRRRKVGDFTAWREGEPIPEEPLQQLIKALQLGRREPVPPKLL